MTCSLFLSLKSAVEKGHYCRILITKQVTSLYALFTTRCTGVFAETGVPLMMERVRNSFAVIDRQVTGLSAQARLWRAAATECHQKAALSSIPDIKSKMLEIAKAYEEMAVLAERYYRAYSKKAGR